MTSSGLLHSLAPSQTALPCALGAAALGAMDEPPAPVLDQLRFRVTDCLDKHLFTTAVFFADKLVTLSDGAAEDVYLLAQVRAAPPHAVAAAGFLKPRLAQAYVHSGQHRRALALLRAEKLTSAGERFLHLAGLCLVAARQWEEAIELLGDGRAAQLQPASRCGATRDMAAACAAAAARRQGWCLTCVFPCAATTTGAWPRPRPWLCCEGACTWA